MDKEIKRLPADFGIRFGIINPSIARQVKDRGLKCDPVQMRKFEKIRSAINDLSFSSFLTYGQIDRLYIKLYNKILMHVGKQNGCDVRQHKTQK